MSGPVFALPGREETLEEFPTAVIHDEQRAIAGYELRDAFARLPFSEQVRLVWDRVERDYWRQDALLTGRSFGSWVLLNGLVQSPDPYPGAVVLCASVLGYGGARGLYFQAPRARRFWAEAETRAGAPVAHLVLVHARDDPQCPFHYAQRLAAAWRCALVEVDNAGHGVGRTTALDEVARVIRDVTHIAGGRRHPGARNVPDAE